MSEFQLRRLGMIMEPEPGNPQEIEFTDGLSGEVGKMLVGLMKNVKASSKR